MTQHATFSIGCSDCGAKFTGFSLVNEPDFEEVGHLIEQAIAAIKESFELHAATCQRPTLCLFKED